MQRKVKLNYRIALNICDKNGEVLKLLHHLLFYETIGGM
ncbi:hypothetical protein JOC76_002657 [Neobacillus cucumis]|nr:hypothetical protein [Neobacillus cucumis]